MIILVGLLIAVTIYGLFIRVPSIACGVAGFLVALFASFGALHAWGEGQSIPWTAGYAVAALTGAACVLRQVFHKNRPSRR